MFKINTQNHRATGLGAAILCSLFMYVKNPFTRP
jgi:hypothetical protein